MPDTTTLRLSPDQRELLDLLTLRYGFPSRTASVESFIRYISYHQPDLTCALNLTQRSHQEQDAMDHQLLQKLRAISQGAGLA